MIDLLVRDGQIVSGSGSVRASLVVDQGRVLAWSAPGVEPPAARTVIDAAGRLVVPGVVDPHVHFYGEGIGAYSHLAAQGGVTTFIGMIRGAPHDRLATVADAQTAQGRAEAIVDFSFHLVLYERDGVLDEIPAMIDRGFRSYKLFMAYRRRGMMVSERFLIAAMAALAPHEAIALVHAEDGEVVDYLEQAFAARGHTAMCHYEPSRPEAAETVAIETAALCAEATGCALYVVHLSSVGGLASVEAARRRGVPVWVETCPQYLLLDDSALTSHGPLAKIAPPLRTPRDRRGLGTALATGAINTVGSDHASHLPEAKAAGGTDVFAAPFGMPGSPTLWPSMYSWAERHKVPLSVLVRAMCEMPARLFGLGSRKGHLAPGADADFMIIDPAASRIVEAETLWPTVAPSPLAGERLSGWPDMTFVRGRAIWRDGAIAVGPGDAQLIPQARVDRCVLH